MVHSMAKKILLYAEDEENDVLLLELGLRKAQLDVELKTVSDGQEALDYLSGSAPYADRQQYPLPDLLLLDLNMPRLSGMQVLAWLRQQPQFTSLPVVIYTSSDHPSDMDKAKQLGATDYVLKPAFVDKIAEALQRLHHKWLDAV
jgi:CheY-like chemotaxis protein